MMGNEETVSWACFPLSHMVALKQIWNSSASSVKGSLLQMKAKAKPSIILLHRMFNPSSLFLSLLFNIRHLILPRFVC